MTALAEARRAIRWLVRHGYFRLAIGRRARHGDTTARVLVEEGANSDPFPFYDAIRARGRLVDNGLMLTTAHHDVVTAVLRSPDLGMFAGASGDAPALPAGLVRAGGRGPLGPVELPSMLTVDPPDHTRYRRLITRAFSARAVAALRSRTEEIAHGLLDAIAAGGQHGDLVAGYAGLLPATVIAEILGAPVAMRGRFLEWGAGAALSLDAGLSLNQFRRSERDLAALQDWMDVHVDAIRRRPGEDILSALVHAHAEDGRLTRDELVSIAILLLGAGFETTVNLIGNGVVLLCAHPDQLALLRAEPAAWPRAIDEVLRIESPVQHTARIAHRDTEVAGERVRAQQLVMLILGGANRDPAVFADPHRFDVTRENAGAHLAFSNGPHFCLGAQLARMEGEVALRVLLERFPGLGLAGPPHRRPNRVLRGYDAMPVRLIPAGVDDFSRPGSATPGSGKAMPRSTISRLQRSTRPSVDSGRCSSLILSRHLRISFAL
jgi:cytochrome P450